jgi:hypothetical protein
MTPEELLHEQRVAVVANAIGFALETIQGGPVSFEAHEGVWLPVLSIDKVTAARYHLAAERAVGHLDRFDARPQP